MARARHEVRRAPARAPRWGGTAEYRDDEVPAFEAVGPARGTGWATGWNLVLGIWLIFSPWILGYGDLAAATWDAVVVGVAIGIFALIRMGWPAQARPISWLNALLGLWLIISPWVVSVDHGRAAPYWNDVIVGILVAVLGCIAAAAPAGRDEARA